MIKIRRILFAVHGHAPARAWIEALEQEQPVYGKPKACARCPLRAGGEWEEGAKKALAQMDAASRDGFGRRWGCHESDRPCAGARRLSKRV